MTATPNQALQQTGPASWAFRGIEPLKHAIVFLLFWKLLLQIPGTRISFGTKKVIRKDGSNSLLFF
ncbi:MAG: hypothetical protein DWH95_09085 [Planctomycetota bacterium]|nr:MAG: hypothetical protein DWH95_09085 [Planctomycetota bacterium]